MGSPKTIFCDLDGTLVKHNEPAEIQNPNLILEVNHIHQIEILLMLLILIGTGDF